MNSEKVTFKRDELYEQVWSEPMKHLAVRYGISDVGLKKICKHMGIPTPERGRWAKLAFGHNVPKEPLPAFEEGKHIATYLFDPDNQYVPPKIPETELQKVLSVISNLPVHERLSTRNPLIQSTQLAYGKVNLGDNTIGWGVENVLSIHVSKQSLQRALCIMEVILKGFVALKFIAGYDNEKEGAYVIVHGEKVHFCIEERYSRTEHIPTQKELDDQKRYSFNIPPQWDYYPSGILSLRIKDTCGGGHRNWTDRSDRIEKKLGLFFKGILVSSKAIQDERLEREERDRKWQIEQQRRREEEHRQYEQKIRFDRLEHDAALWAKSEQLRAFVREAERRFLTKVQTEEHKKGFEEWKIWALKSADSIDPLNR